MPTSCGSLSWIPVNGVDGQRRKSAPRPSPCFCAFLIADGKCAAGLEGSIPVLAHWRLSSLPRYLQSDEVELVIASCDPSTAVGKRDRAILLLLARFVRGGGRGYPNGRPPFASLYARLSLFNDPLRTVLAL